MENVLLLGLGAIGSLVASKFSDSYYPIDILLDEKRYEKYKNDSILINQKKYNFNYVTKNSYHKKSDFVIIATKYTQLEEAIELLDGLISDDCVIMSLLNGINSEEIIGERFGHEKCVHAFITKTDATRINRSTNFVADGQIFFGEKDGAISARCEVIAEIFESINMGYKLTSDIITKQWKKFMVNIGMNQVSAVLNATYGDFLKSDDIMQLTSDAMDEVITIAQAQNINVTERDRDNVLKSFGYFAPDGKTSMLQDVIAKRKTEIDMFAKTLVELGVSLNIPTPINKVLYQQIKAIESMY